jgi:tRNA threonylcarbamoyl adenosine modification protein YjeE
MPAPITLHSLPETEMLAITLASTVQAGDLITLRGDLGVGKSAFARAFIRALCADPLLDVPSPTFTLVNLYDTPAFPIYHADLYRLENTEDYAELGLEDGFDLGVTLIEWPEIIEKWLPVSRLDVKLERCDQNTDARTVVYTPHGTWEKRVL